ncbi:MAG TPA: TauD/TfdA family dioxygenase [Stellaceae bacterium]|nr:TauD/TfdA family dioxygenase [Stellaceae bacterium]
MRGVDFSRPIDPTTAAAVYDARVEHKVVYFRDVNITPEQHVAFGRLFGELTVPPFVPHLDGYPEILVLDNHKDNPVFTTDVWHSDETFRATPPMGPILRCIRTRVGRRHGVGGHVRRL